MSRIAARFAALKRENRAGLVIFVTAGDPDAETSRAILNALPKAGADLIEIGMPFTDPMADGPAIQVGSLRALKAGMTVARLLDLVRGFRTQDRDTPLIGMGYTNPVFAYGAERFCKDAAAAGLDGLIIVDLPPEEAEELAAPARAHGLDLIRLVAPTTPDARLPHVLRETSGFVYYVSITGVTGTKTIATADAEHHVARVRRHTALPVAVGFGIKTPQGAADVARFADAAVVGSALVERIAAGLDAEGRAKPGLAEDAAAFVRILADAVRSARR